jgi:cytochrome d ubiquinol oxidase subunit I
MVFNPSSIERLLHVWLGAFLAGAFLVLSVHAYYLVKGKHIEISKKAFKIALYVATFFSLAQLATGHASAEGVAHNQPAKLAALEGHYPESAAADLYLFGWVDNETKEVTGVKLPGGLSFLLHQDWNAPVTGLDAFPKDEQPGQVNAVFQFYHIMISIGMALIGLTVFGFIQLKRKKLFDQKWLLKAFIWAVLLPQIANQAGWFAAEMGRQPWVVYGLLRTDEAFSQAVSANQIWFSLILFFVIYLLLFVLFLYLLNKKIQNGPFDKTRIQKNPRQQAYTQTLTQ